MLPLSRPSFQLDASRLSSHPWSSMQGLRLGRKAGGRVSHGERVSKRSVAGSEQETGRWLTKERMRKRGEERGRGGGRREACKRQQNEKQILTNKISFNTPRCACNQRIALGSLMEQFRPLHLKPGKKDSSSSSCLLSTLETRTVSLTDMARAPVLDLKAPSTHTCLELTQRGTPAPLMLWRR